MEDRCIKKEKCMNIWKPCGMNCAPMCPMMMHPCMMPPAMQPAIKPVNDPSMHKCAMMQHMMKCPMMDTMPYPYLPMRMVEPMMMEPTMGCPGGCMRHRTMPPWESMNRVEEAIPYVTMRTVRIEEIED